MHRGSSREIEFQITRPFEKVVLASWHNWHRPKGCVCIKTGVSDPNVALHL